MFETIVKKCECCQIMCKLIVLGNNTISTNIIAIKNCIQLWVVDG